MPENASTERPPLLSVTNLSAGYYDDLLILRDVSLQAGSGAITAVLGANGVGKSTLLKTIYGYLRPVEGDIRLGSSSLVGVAPHGMSSLGLGLISQQTSVFGDMTVEENLLMGAWTFRHNTALVRERIERCLTQFPVLHEKWHQKAQELSGGQQRMVELARALMPAPKVLLIDEPSAGLAKMVADEVYEMLRALREQGISILLVDQDIRHALRVADYVYVLELGRNRAEGRAEEFGDVVASFWTTAGQPRSPSPTTTVE